MNNSMCLITTSFVVVANSFVSRDRVDHMGEVVIAFKWLIRIKLRLLVRMLKIVSGRVSIHLNEQ